MRGFASCHSSPRRRRPSRAVWAATASLAAGLALYLVFGLPRQSPPGEIRLARSEADSLALPEIPDDELAIALDYEALRDFDLIDQLELLEVLAAVEDSETPG